MKEKISNRVEVMGYLKENNLEMKATRNGGKSIQGSLTVAFSNLDSIRIDVYAEEKSAAKGTENKAYKSLSMLLPNATTSIKSQLESSPSATFDTVKDVVTKISAHCELREYAVRDENGKESTRVKVQLLNWFDSIHPANPAKPFEPGANFTIDAYIESIRPEMKAENGSDPEETGRYIVVGLTPDFTGAMQRISYVTEAGAVSEYISQNWKEGENTYFTGTIHNLMKMEQKAGVTAGFGQSAIGTVTTTFIDERLIRGGGQTTFDANDTGMEQAGFTSEDVRKGLLLREEAIKKNTEKRLTKSTNTVAAPAQPQPTKDFGFGGFDPKGF